MHICHYNCIWLCQLNGLSNLGPIFLMKHKFRQLGVSTNQVPCNFLLLQSQPVVPWSQKGCHTSRRCICTRNRRNERKRNRNSMPADIIYQEITDFLKILPHGLPFTFHLPSLVHVATQNCKRTWEIELLQLDALLSQIKLEFDIKKKEGMDVVQTIKVQAMTLSRVSAYINLQ